jgi:hypothetical protein
VTNFGRSGMGGFSHHRERLMGTGFKRAVFRRPLVLSTETRS